MHIHESWRLSEEDVASLRKGDPSNIVIKENFIKCSDLEEIMAYCPTMKEFRSGADIGIDSIHSSVMLEKNSPKIYKILAEYVNNVQAEIEYKFGRTLEPQGPGLRKWYPGEHQELHADGESAGGWPSYNYIVDYGSIMYLNDDYEGGEIFFPAYGIHLKPKSGTLIFFPSSQLYAHGVTEIISGIRYTSPHFWVPNKHRILVEMATAEIATTDGK
jgi:hypothetical protein